MKMRRAEKHLTNMTPELESKRVFCEFLRKHKAYKRFRANMGKDGRFEDYYDYTSKVKPALLMFSAFIWRNTKEGREYWESLENHWILYLVNKERNK